MNLTEQYPLDVTKAGDSVKDAILKNRSEILGVMDSLNDQPAGSVGDARNRVLSAHMVNNVFNYLSSDGLAVAIDGSITPVLITFADGYNGNGAVDYISSIYKLVSAWTVPANNTSYLYIDRDSSGNITYGSTTHTLIVSTTMPDVTKDDSDINWYNPETAVLNTWNGTEWNRKLRVFVGSVTTDATTVTNISYQEVSKAMSVAERHKLEAIDIEATKNDYCYKGVSVGDTEVTASGKQDVLTLKTVGDIKATADTANRTITLTVEIMGQIYQQAVKDAKLQAHPVGSIYESTDATSPADLFGGTWEAMDPGRVLVSAGTASTGTVYKAGDKGGEEKHQLSESELPVTKITVSGTTEEAGYHRHSIITKANEAKSTSPQPAFGDDGDKVGYTNYDGNHTHKFSGVGQFGGSIAHNNMPPYQSIFRWVRIA